tara:strand:+ start:907 stop:1149 length:243 start_codon:yes stop_codon:yes gene_type:complete
MYEGYIERRASERNGMAKLTYAKAQRIRRMYASGMKQGDIAAKFGVAAVTISSICCNRSYTTPPTPLVKERQHRATRNHR